jgi:8-oxo-dGTP pyrophosphatase MutT (NUDIX family)
MQADATKRLSCGIVVLTPQRELLLCHVTGRGHWDLPKGGIDAGESPLEAALRETREETGLLFDGAELLDVGRHVYSERKHVHLFAARAERFDTARLTCESHFSHAWSGTRLPEMDGYGWFDIARAPALCAPKMTRLLTETIDLAALLERLTRTVTPRFAPVEPAAALARAAALASFASSPAFAA